MRLLIIDDSSTIRKIVRNLLNSLIKNCQIMEAQNGVEAIFMLQENPNVDLIFTDYVMPDMDGLAFVKKVRETPSIASKSIVAVTSNFDSEVINSFKKLGVSSFISKPLSAEKFRVELERYIPEDIIKSPLPQPTGEVCDIAENLDQHLFQEQKSLPEDNKDEETIASKYVLIVDDSQMIRKVVKTNLMKLGIRKIEEAIDGYVGLGILANRRKKKTHIVLLDHNMPKMNGLEFLDTLKKGEQQHIGKIIVMTSEKTEGLVEAYQKRGITEFLPKPFEKKDFDSKIQEALLVNAEGEVDKSMVIGEQITGKKLCTFFVKNGDLIFNFEEEKTLTIKGVKLNGIELS